MISIVLFFYRFGYAFSFCKSSYGIRCLSLGYNVEKYCLGFREYLVDLVGKPGHLWEPDSLLNGPSTISISSPLRFPRPRPVEPAVDYRSLAKQYFTDSQALNLVFDPASGIPV